MEKWTALFKVNFGHFDLFIWSTKEKIIEDMHYLCDEAGGKLMGEQGGSGFEKIEFICYNSGILEIDNSVYERDEG